MKAMFCFSKAMPSTTATMPSADGRDPRDPQLRRAVGLALVEHRGIEVVETAEAPDSVRPATTARMVAKATAEMKPRKTLPPTASARCTAAMLLPPSSLALVEVTARRHRHV